MLITCPLVPSLENEELLLLSRQEVLAGSCFQPLRTDTLSSSPRKYLFLKLLHHIVCNSKLKVQIAYLLESQDMSLRSIVDLTEKDNDYKSNVDCEQPLSEIENGNLGAADAYYDGIADAAAVIDDDAAVAATVTVSASTKGKGKFNPSSASERQKKALKQIESFGDFSFKNGGANTRNGGSSNSAETKPPPVIPKKKKTYPKSAKNTKTVLSSKGKSVIKFSPVGSASSDKVMRVQRSAGSATSWGPSCADQKILESINAAAKAAKLATEELKREQEQAKLEREHLKREREQFQKAHLALQQQSLQGLFVFFDLNT